MRLKRRKYELLERATALDPQDVTLFEIFMSMGTFMRVTSVLVTKRHFMCPGMLTDIALNLASHIPHAEWRKKRRKVRSSTSFVPLPKIIIIIIYLLLLLLLLPSSLFSFFFSSSFSSSFFFFFFFFLLLLLLLWPNTLWMVFNSEVDMLQKILMTILEEEGRNDVLLW